MYCSLLLRRVSRLRGCRPAGAELAAKPRLGERERVQSAGRALTPSHLTCCQPWLESSWSERGGKRPTVIVGSYRERKGRTKTLLYTCGPASDIPTPRSFTHFLPRSSISDPTLQNSISFIMSPKATGVSQESAVSALKRNPIDSDVRLIA